MKRYDDTKKLTRRVCAVAAIALGALALASARVDRDSPPPAPNRYIGASKCKNCHNKDEGGNQYGKWMEARHSKAFETLASDAAKAAGAKLGVDDPQKSDKCLKCHTTAFGKPKEEIKRGFKIEHGVQCESCHGPGEKHMKARFMAASQLGDEEPPAFTTIPDDEQVKNPPKETCYECHSKESPTFKRFCYYEYVAKVRHLNPKKPRTDEERAAMLVCGCGDACACVEKCPDDGCGVPPKKK